MTIEQRLSRLEAAAGINDMPTNGRQATYTIIDRYKDGNKLHTVRRLSDMTIFKVGDTTRLYNLDFKIKSFEESHNKVYARIIYKEADITVPLSDLIPFTTGGMSADWLQGHGVSAPSVKEWEIVEFRTCTDNSYWTLTEEGYYKGSVTNRKYPLNDMLSGRMSVETGDIHIHSVRRPYDSTTWTVGDQFRSDLFGTRTIKSFRITGETQLLVEFNGGSMNFLGIEPVLRKPLFTTADGVPVQEGDTIWFWQEGFNIEERKASLSRVPMFHYSTHAAALAAYNKWLYEQPVLSLNDLRLGMAMEVHENIVKDKLAKG